MAFSATAAALKPQNGPVSVKKKPGTDPAALKAILSTATFTASRSLVDGSSTPFTSAGGYLQMALPNAPKNDLLGSLKKTLGGIQLGTPSQAHITVLTPGEWSAVTSAKGGNLSPARVEAIAKQNGLQGAVIKPIGLGMGSVGTMSTYFVVVDAPQLRAIRQAIADEITAKGGTLGAFKPGTYYPHITVGYTTKDLHIEQGVVKDANSRPNQSPDAFKLK